MLVSSTTTGLQYGLGLGAVLLSGYFAAVTWNQRRKPTVQPLLLVAVVVFLGSIAYLVTSYPPAARALTPIVWPDAAGPIWIGLLFVLVIVVSGLWFLFALEYTGRGGPLVRPATATVAALWALVFGVAVFGDFSPPPEGVQTHVEFALGFGVFFLTILLAIGVVLVLTTSLQQNAIEAREGVALSGGPVILALGSIVLNTTQHPAVFPVTVLLASGLFVLAISRYPVFEAPPVVRIAGRDRLIEEMDDAVVVTDLEGRIHDLNPAAERSLETDRAAALGEPIETLLPAATEPSDLAAADGPIEIRPSPETTLAITANRITDARDRSFGYLLVCRDVTERQRRERRLGVLTQLLTGAIIDRMATVAETAATLTRSERQRGFGHRPPDEPDPSRVGGEIRRQTSALVRLVTRTREIERALAEEGPAEADTVSILRTVVDAVAEDDAIELEIEPGESVPPAAMDAAVLETILETILEGAVEPERTRLSLETADGERTLAIHVVDDGPIAPETAVDAGSDRATGGGEEEQSFRELSIEMARLAATHVGGDVSVQPDGDGHRIVIQMPTIEARSANEIEPILADGSTGTSGGSG